ncbi:hypothetical protein Patl1_23712 [Pistacia atlantica]|uniref:Uncharacterized protein n=1 Tax=Pistacia atlantica TaxID=434234 RepID=A0ACC0ZWQ6_9ROSI|nr:hypothetical protein Patl1_23712 [Pistacia atlantica]
MIWSCPVEVRSSEVRMKMLLGKQVVQDLCLVVRAFLPLYAAIFSSLSDFYKILEVDYDATDEKIRLNYRRLALKWHPDKHNGDSAVTEKFQEINEAYKGNSIVRAKFCILLSMQSPLELFVESVLSDPDKRLEYDFTGIYEIDKYTLREYLARFKGMILTCNGLGISQPSIW